MALAALGRAAPRPRHHRRHLRPGRLRGHPGDGHRLPHDPRLLALRHRRRVRQGAREHQRGGRERQPADLQRRRRTWRSTRPWCGRSTPRSSRCCRSPRMLFVGAGLLGAGHAQRPRARAVRRSRGRHLLLDLHRDAAAGRPAGARAGDAGAAQAGRRCQAPHGRASRRPRPAGGAAGEATGRRRVDRRQRRRARAAGADVHAAAVQPAGRSHAGAAARTAQPAAAPPQVQAPAAPAPRVTQAEPRRSTVAAGRQPAARRPGLPRSRA